MIESEICINCICLPVCLSKTNTRVIEDCTFFINTLTNISYSIPVADCIDIYFKDLDRTIEVRRSPYMLYVQITETVKHILTFMDRKDLRA